MIRRGVLSFAAFLIILSPVIASGNNEYVKYVKTGSFYDYPDQTIEEGVDNLFSRPKWSYDGYSEGMEYVSVKGKIYYMEKKADAMMQFEIDPDNGSFSIYALEINDIPQNQLTIYGMKTAMFE